MVKRIIYTDTTCRQNEARKYKLYRISTNYHASKYSLLLLALEYHPVSRRDLNGKGVYLTIEVEDVDAYYKELQEKGVPIALALKDEPWGDRHFSIVDPNGIGIDIVTYAAPE